MYVNTNGTKANVMYRAGSRKMFKNRIFIVALIISQVSGSVLIGSKPTPLATALPFGRNSRRFPNSKFNALVCDRVNRKLRIITKY
jgi:hypothetical protein